MALQVGSRLGHYDVTALIGEGGMGQVYQATDTKLNRQVALKILPEAFATDPDRLARFQREAQVLASLNHPGIAAIYGIEESGDTRALVLELVEGPTLADRIAQGPIPVDEALPIAKQIAEALEAAHEAGVIHRDLKPANIKVRDDGTVKVLDFGLAKALDTTPEGDPSESPTLTAAATQMGVILGTAAYMSPEQARGKTVDKRADIWAFGCVLFEMLTGLRPFQGEDVSLTLAAVMTFEPDLDLLPETLSPTLQTYLIRCLAKDPRERLRDIGDVRLAMKGAFETAASAPPEGTATPQPSVWQRPVPLLLGAGLLVAISGLAVWSVTRSGPPTVQPTKRFVITQPASNAIAPGFPGHYVALSPDGRTLVYVGENDGVRQLFRRSMDQLEVIPLRDTENAIAPSFSLDGEWVTFISGLGGPLVKVSLAGGSAFTIMQHPDARARAWGPDDTIVFGTFGSGLFRVSANGGDPEPLTTPAEEGESHREPHFLPDVGALLFVVRSRSGDGGQLAVYSFETGEWHELSLEGARPHYSLGHIMFSREDALWAVPFEVDRLALTGDAFLVLEGVTSTGQTQFDVARDGTIVYVPEGALGAGDARTLTWVDREGISTPLREERLPYRNPRFSPDGRRLLLQIRDEGTSHIWVLDVERGTLTPLTFKGAFNGLPIWSPDGTYVTFSSSGRAPTQSLYQRRADGSGDVDLLLDKEQRQLLGSWSPDGVLAFYEFQFGTGSDIWVLEDGVPRAFIVTDAREMTPMFSPDGQWMAYESDKSGQSEVYLSPYPGPGGERQVSTDGGRQPRWSPDDGRELFYQAGAGQVMSVSVQTSPSVELGTPQLLFEVANMVPGFDVHPDGERFVVVTSGGSDSSTSQINVVLNWLEEHTDRVQVP